MREQIIAPASPGPYPLMTRQNRRQCLIPESCGELTAAAGISRYTPAFWPQPTAGQFKRGFVSRAGIQAQE